MNNSVYTINKGINKSIEFKGLKAQYIWYFGGGILVLMVIFSLLYLAGLNTYLCMTFILGAGALLTVKIYHWSNTYGEHGMMKAIASRKTPKLIKNYSRTNFQHLNRICS
ncbi:DUF4133 domain-containing protein [Pedobacter foliorum]|uniref:DUF4133 domain-containing protein n=1 Tax=Pedobacter foliorum TaxID=2739058 RepID=UPI001566425F|nr:DUF4133 domain-containing protein [Pedobacter foliorum]NRF41108.1 DUF4133 domain-containing protein [Pedobacter foliorum]